MSDAYENMRKASQLIPDKRSSATVSPIDEEKIPSYRLNGLELPSVKIE